MEFDLQHIRTSSRSNLFSSNKQSSININTETPTSTSSNPFMPPATTISTPSIPNPSEQRVTIPNTPQPVFSTPSINPPPPIINDNVHKRTRDDIASTPSQPLTIATPNSNAQSTSAQKTTPGTGDSAKKRKYNITVVINNREYSVYNKIGSGGSCSVYKCVDSETQQEVAIKHIKIQKTDDNSIVKGFLDEARLLEKLRVDDYNNNIIKLLDYEYRPHRSRDEILLVMELGSSDFNTIIKKHNANTPFTPEELRIYWRQMLESVAFIHSKKIVHTDIKPANFLLVKNRLKLIDFGIAKIPDHDNTQSISRNAIVGTLNFMPPESFTTHTNTENGTTKYKFGPPGDIWSLGIIFYQTIYHKTPFADLDHLHKIAHITDKNTLTHFPPVEEQYEEAVSLLKTILMKDPNHRPSISTILQHDFFKPKIVPVTVSLKDNSEQTTFGNNVMKTFQYLLSKLPSQSLPPQYIANELLRLCHEKRDGDKMSEDDISRCINLSSQ